MSINKGKPTIVEEESQEQSQSMSNTEREVSNLAIVGVSQVSTMILQRYTSNEGETSQTPLQEDLVRNFTEERNKSTNENYRLMEQIRKSVPNKSSLLAVREAQRNIFRVATSDMAGVSQVKIQMDQVGIPDKINFHKQASEVLYPDLLSSYLRKIKLEENAIKLEEQVKRDRVASKGWKTQAKKLEVDLGNLTLVLVEKKANKKLIE